MENAKYETLSVGSFSKSWLINSVTFETEGSCSLRSSVDGGPSSFIEMDPRLPASKRFMRDTQYSNFHFPESKTPVHLVHAEDIFRNGQILPRTSSVVLTNASPAADEDTFGPDASRNLPLTGSICKNFVSSSRGAPVVNKLSSVESSKTVSKSMLQKYLSCLQPLFTCRRGVRSKVAENCIPSSPETPPRTSVASYSVDGHWRRSSSSESSIDEAVLHCKRSISKSLSTRRATQRPSEH